MAWDPMLEFVSAVNNQTPEGYLRTQADASLASSQADYDRAVQVALSNMPPPHTPDKIRLAQESVAMQPQFANRGYLTSGQFDEQLANSAETAQAAADHARITDPLRTGFAADSAARNQNAANLGSAFQSATAGNAGLLGDLRGAASAADQRDAALLSAYGNSINQANGIDSQAVGNLSSLYNSMGQLQASGYVGDVTSDAGLVGAQRDVMNGFGAYANGAGDIQSQAALATADAEALAAQKDVLGKLKERSDPRLTDAERALFMEARLQREQSDRANRDANMTELARRGMSGSTMALSNLNASSAEAGQNRALADTKAAGQAVQRAEAALRDYGGMSNVIAGQSFDRSFRTGAAADSVAAGNRDARMQGLQGQGTMATNMRSADDAIRTFNQGQRQQQQQFSDNYRATQQQQAWGRGTDMAGAQMSQANNIATRAGGVADRGMAASQAQFGRQGAITSAGVGMNRDYLDGYTNVVGASNTAIRDNATDRRGIAALDTVGAQIDAQGRQNSNAIAQKYRDQTAEQARASAAMDREDARWREEQAQARDLSQDSALFGLGSLFNWSKG